MAGVTSAAMIQGPDPTDVVGRRVVAWFIDGLISYLFSLAIIYALGINDLANQDPERADPNQVLATALSLLIIFLVWFGIRVILIGAFGWTLGKLICGLRVVRYDGRPPGMARAFVRSLVDGLGQGFLSCFYDVPALFTAMATKGHRQPADMAAGTYVIDVYYLGRVLIRKSDKVVAGPQAMTREEMEESLHAQGISTPFVIPEGRSITEPFFDKNLQTHVVYSRKRGEWMRYDKKSDTWEPIEMQPTTTTLPADGGFDPGDRADGPSLPGHPGF